MKYFLITIISLFSLIQSNAQDEDDFRLSFVAEAHTLNGNRFPSFGLRGEYFTGHYISLNYKITMGYNPDREFWMHVSTPVMATSWLGDSELLYLSLFIPEGVSFHIYPNDWLEASPYIDPLGCEMNLLSNNSVYLSCSWGMRLHIKPTKNFSITPDFGMSILYKDSKTMTNYGLAFGWLF